MPCPTCSHTLQNLGLATSGVRTFWCPRCGTIKTEFGVTTTDDRGGSVRETREEHEAPKWARPVSGVPDCRRLLAHCWQLVYDPGFDLVNGGYEGAKRYLRGREGDAREALDQIAKADGD